MAQDMDYIFKNKHGVSWTFHWQKGQLVCSGCTKIKLTLDGKPKKFKMRLMAKGYE
jgi:hypothetical protein